MEKVKALWQDLRPRSQSQPHLSAAKQLEPSTATATAAATATAPRVLTTYFLIVQRQVGNCRPLSGHRCVAIDSYWRGRFNVNPLNLQ